MNPINNSLSVTAMYTPSSQILTKEPRMLTPTSDQVSISAAGRNAEDKWQAIADKYDMTNISLHERGAMTAELLENKLISSAEGLAMMAPNSMNEDPDTKVNFLDMTQNGLEAAKSNGTPINQIKIMESLVGILDQLYSLASNNNGNSVSSMNYAYSEDRD